MVNTYFHKLNAYYWVCEDNHMCKGDYFVMVNAGSAGSLNSKRPFLIILAMLMPIFASFLFLLAWFIMPFSLINLGLQVDNPITFKRSFRPIPCHNNSMGEGAMKQHSVFHL